MKQKESQYLHHFTVSVAANRLTDLSLVVCAVLIVHSKFMTDIEFFHPQQTNTADMLEEAVEYVKFLQRQIQVIHEVTPVIVYSKTHWQGSKTKRKITWTERN